MKKRVVTIIMIAVVLLIVFVGTRQVIRSKAELPKSITELQEEYGIPVEVATVERGTYILNRSYLGTVEGALQADIVSSLSEDIVSLPVKVGDRVAAGQVVCKLDPRASMAQYNQLKLAYDDAKADAERMQNLYAAGAISKQNLEKAQLARDIAQKNLESSSQVVQLTTPFAGIVTEVFYRRGEKAEAGKPVVRVADLSRVKIKFSADFEDWRQIDRNTPISIMVDGNGKQEHPAAVAEISLAADPKSHLFNLWIEADNEEGLLQPGLLVDVSVTVLQKPDVVLVPRNAVLVRNNRTGVFLIDENRRAHFTVFQQGEANIEVVEAVSGIQAGATVVTYGHNNLENDQLVNVVES